MVSKHGRASAVASGGETYAYDAEGDRVEVNGPSVTDYIYFGGKPVATVDKSGNYTDLIYAGGALIAEAAGTETAAPTYRVTDMLGSFVGYGAGSGALSGATDYSPYGDVFSGANADMFGFTGLQWDGTTALWHAQARQFSPQQGRWMTPDPYTGSYDWSDPQSLNRYAVPRQNSIRAQNGSGFEVRNSCERDL